MGEGVTVDLPLPGEHEWGLTYTDPQELDLSEDGKTLTYAYHHAEPMLSGAGTEEERVVHEAGTYRCTVDLTTGEVSPEIVPD